LNGQVQVAILGRGHKLVQKLRKMTAVSQLQRILEISRTIRPSASRNEVTSETSETHLDIEIGVEPTKVEVGSIIIMKSDLNKGLENKRKRRRSNSPTAGDRF
jgi:hypothetical protein